MISRASQSVVVRTLVLLLLSIVLSSPVQASIELAQCGQDVLALQQHLQAYTDQSGKQTHAQVQQLPTAAWQEADRGLLTPGFSQAAHWYRTSINNAMATECELWLDLNTLHITDVQVYTRQPAEPQWQLQRAGAHYPFAQWAGGQRIPSIPLLLPAGKSTELLLRVSSEHGVLLAPQLLSQQSLIKKRMTSGLVDGVIYGAVGLLVLISLLMGYFFRLKVLTFHALTVALYTLYLSLVVGYAFVHLWPEAVRWNAQLIMAVGLAMRIMLLQFLGELLQIKDQPKRNAYCLLAVQLALALWLGLRLVFPEAQWLAEGGVLSVAVWLWTLLVVVLILYTGVQKKQPYSWFSYFVSVLVLTELLVLIFFSLGISPIAPLEYNWLSVSAVPAALLLSYTLVSKLIQLRRREQSALAELEHLKAAEQSALEQRVELRTEQLRDALRNQNMLLARISHDLRAPLQHVIRDAGLLQQMSQPAGRYGQSIQRAAHQQLELIDELLEYSRGELKQLELLVAPGYLFGFLHEIEESGVFLAERNNNRFVSDLHSELPLLVNADFRRLRQVIMNLLANATKFTQNGLIEFKVNLIHLDKQAGYAEVKFAVADNGIGIPQDERENLLEPFQRGASSANYSGVGLGLYIVRQLLDSMHSQLQIDSSASGGVCCHFTLRLELAGEQELEQVFIESYSSNSEGQQRCVLIVDDVEIAQEMLYELLAGYDYNPIVCSSAAEALVILRDHPVDLIITDQVMPVMDGWDLLRKVRHEWPTLPVLLYSARPAVRPKDLDSAIEFDTCLLKPATTSDLLAQIDRLLAQTEWLG